MVSSLDLLTSETFCARESSTILWARAGTGFQLRGEVLHCGNWEPLDAQQHAVVSVDPAWMRNYLHWDPLNWQGLPSLPPPRLSLHLPFPASRARGSSAV